MRRYQLGYIKLISPITHVWYLKGNPSYLSILLDIKKRHLESVTYCSESLTIENSLKGKSASSNASDIVSSWKKLKQQIITSKIENLLGSPKQELTSKIYFLQTKLKKRDQLKILKQNSWRTLYGSTQSNESTEIKNLSQHDYEPGYSRSKVGLTYTPTRCRLFRGSLAQVFEKHDFNSQTGSQRSNLMGQIKNYFQTINFKSLLQLSIIFKNKRQN
jgi:DNA-directed RNA polymerase beta' subunit